MVEVFCIQLYWMKSELGAFIFHILYKKEAQTVVCFLIVKQSATIVGPLLTEVWREEGGLLLAALP